jgi:hypothetical protein
VDQRQTPDHERRFAPEGGQEAGAAPGEVPELLPERRRGLAHKLV